MCSTIARPLDIRPPDSPPGASRRSCAQFTLVNAHQNAFCRNVCLSQSGSPFSFCKTSVSSHCPSPWLITLKYKSAKLLSPDSSNATPYGGSPAPSSAKYLRLCVDRYVSSGVIDDHVGSYAAVVPERTSYLRGNRYVRVCSRRVYEFLGQIRLEQLISKRIAVTGRLPAESAGVRCRSIS